MSDKLLAGFVTAAVVAPICSVCVLGPAAVGSLLMGGVAWFGGAGPLLTLALMAAMGVLVVRTLRRRRQRGGIPGERRGPAPDVSAVVDGAGAHIPASGLRSLRQDGSP